MSPRSQFQRNSDSGFESISYFLDFGLDFTLSSIGSLLYAPPAQPLATSGALLAESLASPALVSKVLRFRRKTNAIRLAKHIRTRVAPPTPMPISAPVPSLCVLLSPACEMVTVAAVIAVLVGAAVVETYSAIPELLRFAVVIPVFIGATVIKLVRALPLSKLVQPFLGCWKHTARNPRPSI